MKFCNIVSHMVLAIWVCQCLVLMKCEDCLVPYSSPPKGDVNGFLVSFTSCYEGLQLGVEEKKATELFPFQQLRK